MFLTACPSDDGECDVFNREEASAGPIIELEPRQNSYQVGDIIELSLRISNDVMIFDRPVDLRAVTGLDAATIGFSRSDLFDGNTVQTVIGSQQRLTTYVAPYIPEDESYELRLAITLERPGDYNWISGAVFSLTPNRCVGFSINAFVETSSMDGIINFTVQP